jgi:leucyl/phenylalanyl-tRNA--protein transferase
MPDPIEPPPCPWAFPPVEVANDEGLVCIGGDLEPGTVLAAYRNGLFPMPIPAGRGRRRRDETVLGWWSPDPRGVLPLDGLHVSRSLRKSVTRFEVRVDTAFERVVLACGDPSRPHGWISTDIVAAYVELHRLGWAHSVETWREGELVGGLYGLGIGGFFAGESMFHTATDASKVALVALVERLRAGGATLLDVQWCTEHLASLGAGELSRPAYLDALAVALAGPTIAWTALTTSTVSSAAPVAPAISRLDGGDVPEQGLPYTAHMRGTTFADDPGAGTR